ncbi:MAG: superinfection immunity protein [Rubritepida sp.]|jgi:Na+/melibiose symporter-like transporter|nr:superinfection immunity protein [Rubritepida sp.]
MEEWVAVVAFVIAVVLYFLPFIVAKLRGSAHVTGVFIVNLFLGATGVGWVGALVWAFASETKRDRERRRAVEETILRRL